MAPVFTLVRAFAISALLVGALPAVFSAPVPGQAVETVGGHQAEKRYFGACWGGCYNTVVDPSSDDAEPAPAKSVVPDIIAVIKGLTSPSPSPSKLASLTDGDNSEEDDGTPNALLKFNYKSDSKDSATTKKPISVNIITLDAGESSTGSDLLDKILDAIPEVSSSDDLA
ncbi:hypothetical protein BXZ70DRAFT_1044428 [Cristinia sonorae]|uniref:Uncharacterized protein n=1 Tax=Cristinia sonorae TaxID=1940300 RepID=A0A8K0UHA7_9AGAR|nr:hypothetical protein BXZ70DRAFT_1044428 [Cristinia sonorae]